MYKYIIIPLKKVCTITKMTPFKMEECCFCNNMKQWNKMIYIKLSSDGPSLLLYAFCNELCLNLAILQNLELTYSMVVNRGSIDWSPFDSMVEGDSW